MLISPSMLISANRGERKQVMNEIKALLIEVEEGIEMHPIRGCLLAAIMILHYDYEMHTYLRYA